VGLYLRTVQDVVYHMFLQVSAWPYFPRGVKTLRILKNNKRIHYFDDLSVHKYEIVRKNFWERNQQNQARVQGS